MLLLWSMFSIHYVSRSYGNFHKIKSGSSETSKESFHYKGMIYLKFRWILNDWKRSESIDKKTKFGE